jgi:hypothetical protein
VTAGGSRTSLGVRAFSATFNDGNDGVIVMSSVSGGKAVTLFDSAAVPEPSVFVMMIIGSLGLLCHAWHKRK